MKTGRKRIYEGSGAERHRQASREYVKKMREEAKLLGVPLTRYLQKNKKQLNVAVDLYLYNRLKAEAERRNMTLKDVVVEKLSR